MKGVVFTEFLEMVENTYGLEAVDELLITVPLASSGAYTSVGTYDHQELIQLVVTLAEQTHTPVVSLLHTFGKYLFKRFVAGYPSLFVGKTSALEFLEGLDSYIHVEVLKLYPDAELPKFVTTRLTPDVLEMIYTSKRPLADFAVGLIQGCGDHFHETIDVRSESIADPDMNVVKFTLTRTGVEA